MAGRNCADIVFCIDASGSMRPAIDAVRQNISSLLRGLTGGGIGEQHYGWDVRFDFLAFQSNRQGLHSFRSLREGVQGLIRKLYRQSEPEAFFTRDVEAFCRALDAIVVEDEEMPLAGLDFALDFPWRPSGDCHRVVVLLSDEDIATTLFPDRQKQHIPALIDKIMARRVRLFIIAPESESYYALAEADRCEYTDLQSDGVGGLRNVDFSHLLESIGKSVSVSQTYGGGDTTPCPLFGQQGWSDYNGPINVNPD